MRCLLVEDIPVTQRTLSEFIHEKLGWDVKAAYTFDIAVELMSKHEFDIVVSDWHLGEDGANGIDVCRRAKEKGLVTVMLTAYPIEQDSPWVDRFLEKRSGLTQIVEELQLL